MRPLYAPLAILLAFSTFPPLNGQTGRMAFVNRQGSINHIYLMDVDASGVGVNPVRLTSDEEAENYPSWYDINGMKQSDPPMPRRGP